MSSTTRFRHLLSLFLMTSTAALGACADENVSLLPAPGATDIGSVEQDTQCGSAWDAQQVERYDGTLGVSQSFVRRHEPHVGYHVGPGCSGTLISDDLFISAGHCGYAVGDAVRFNYQNAPDGTTARATQDYTVATVVEQEVNSSYDYAIVRLNGSPGRTFGHASIAAIDPPAGSLLTIIGHPARRPKEIHSGPVLDYSSSVGSNWFRHQVDTVGGNSGSGVLDANGQLVGIHTNGGCNTTTPIEGNSAVRMSALVAHSTTLQALTRSKILWRNNDGRISLWTLAANGTLLNYIEHTVGLDWTPISYSDNRILWRNNDGRISYWVINDAGQHLTYAESGPFPGWTAVNHANDRILWRHTDGRISLWTVNSVGNYVSHKEHGPFAGWTALFYANNHIVWRNTDGRISIWRVNDAGEQVSYAEYGPIADWMPISFENNTLLWRHPDGRTSYWTLSLDSMQMHWQENGPFGGWTALGAADRKQLWCHDTRKISYWNINSDGQSMSYVEHGPFAGWTPMFTAGGRP
jgi:hypothetical protein